VLENAVQFEQMAADTKDPKLKAEFERKALSYRLRAANRAKEYGLKPEADKDSGR
jgi:hypothetical protein